MTRNQALPARIHRRLPAWCLLAAVLGWSMLAGAPAVWAASKPLQVYFIDVDGGQSTLFVTPAGKSLLIDTGWASNGLDAGPHRRRGERRRREQDRLPLADPLPC